MADAHRSFLKSEPDSIGRIRRRLLGFHAQLMLLGLRADDLDGAIQLSALRFAVRNLIAITIDYPLQRSEPLPISSLIRQSRSPSAWLNLMRM